MSSSQPLRWPARVESLPRTLDRFRATSVFFDVKFPFFLAGSLSALRWVSWGALAALASIPEVLERELEEIGLADTWRASVIREAIRRDPLLAILRELRNYETHLAFIERRRSSTLPIAELAHEPEIHSSYFAPVSFSQLAELRNIRDGRSPVTQETVEHFNHLAERYSVKGVVDLAMDRLSSLIYEFISEHQLNGALTGEGSN